MVFQKVKRPVETTDSASNIEENNFSKKKILENEKIKILFVQKRDFIVFVDVYFYNEKHP